MNTSIFIKDLLAFCVAQGGFKFLTQRLDDFQM